MAPIPALGGCDVLSGGLGSASYIWAGGLGFGRSMGRSSCLLSTLRSLTCLRNRLGFSICEVAR